MAGVVTLPLGLAGIAVALSTIVSGILIIAFGSALSELTRIRLNTFATLQYLEEMLNGQEVGRTPVKPN